MRTVQRTFPGMIFLAIFLSALILSGCHRARRDSSEDTKKETSITTPSPQEATQPGKPSKSSGPASIVETPGAPKGSTTAAEPGQDPISSGSVLLNPAVPKDAEMIQTRLAELKLYKGPIDGIWGKGSRAGLKVFKEENSLDDPEKWDKETQVLLFGGADTAAGASEEADEESISSGEIILNPDKEKDARIIQKRLAELGLYKGAIDGIWGKGSQAALRAFRERNSIVGRDKWDKETQLLLFHK